MSASPQFWVDAQLYAALEHSGSAERSQSMPSQSGISGFREAEDSVIFRAARERAAVVVTKDSDFVQLLDRYGAPPQVLWLTCGNTSNARLRTLLAAAWPRVSALLAAGEPLIEISDPAT